MADEGKTGLTGSFLAGRKHAPAHLGRVLVLGLGKSGKSVLEYCAGMLGGRVEALVVVAGESTDEAEHIAQEMRPRGVEVVFGCKCVEGAYDLCIASPGIPQRSALYESALATCGEVIGEIEFAWRESAESSRWVAITGTNGKTTTTSLAAATLSASGLRACAVGNIGEVCLDAVAAGGTDVYVAEVSSYQLASTRLFAPNVAVILNITPDHLSWHGGFREYAEAKYRVLANLDRVPGSVAVLAAADDEVRSKVRELKAMGPDRGFDYLPIGTASGLRESMIDRCGAEAAAFVEPSGALRIDYRGVTHRYGTVESLLLKGDHNVENALAAAATALAFGLPDDAVARAFSSFAPLEHRIEPCGTIDGVSFVNDSKATNVDAAIRAFSAFPDGCAIALLGGCDKMTDLAPLVDAVRAHAKAAVCFGAAGERFAAAFLHSTEDSDAADGVSLGSMASDAFGLPVVRALHLADAFDAACSIARSGDVVLLSPACSSFDEFSCFEERGDAFKALVAARAGEGR